MTGSFRAIRNEKGEGFLPNLLLLLVIGAIAYGAYYFYNKTSKPAATAPVPGALERTEKDARPGSPAGAAVQQAQEMGTTAAQ